MKLTVLEYEARLLVTARGNGYFYYWKNPRHLDGFFDRLIPDDKSHQDIETLVYLYHLEAGNAFQIVNSTAYNMTSEQINGMLQYVVAYNLTDWLVEKANEWYETYPVDGYPWQRNPEDYEQ
jgi:hypothetical protein